MDKQLLEIRKARKELSDMDFEDFGHDIDLELWRCDEIIDWTRYWNLDVCPLLPSVSEWKQNATQIAWPTEILMIKQPLEMARRKMET
jgi:hypothetical protein